MVLLFGNLFIFVVFFGVGKLSFIKVLMEKYESNIVMLM